MTRSSTTLALFCLVNLLRTGIGFTISLAPLLTSLGPWGSKYVDNFSALSSPPSTKPMTQSTESSKMNMKSGATQNFFKFEDEDCRMISGCKSECLELIYARSLERGFESA